MNSIFSVSRVAGSGRAVVYSTSEASHKAALKKYSVIEPLVKVSGRRRTRNRGESIDFLARRHGIGQRTIYNWLRDWNAGGLPALGLKLRADKGQSQ